MTYTKFGLLVELGARDSEFQCDSRRPGRCTVGVHRPSPPEVAELSTRSASSTTNTEWDVADQEEGSRVNPLEGADNLCEHKYRQARGGPVSPVLATEQRKYPHGD